MDALGAEHKQALPDRETVGLGQAVIPREQAGREGVAAGNGKERFAGCYHMDLHIDHLLRSLCGERVLYSDELCGKVGEN